MLVICELLGVPESVRSSFRRWSDAAIVATDGRASMPPDAVEAIMEMVGFLDQLAKDKAADPADDIVSQLVAAEVEGRPLTAGELVTFTMSLVVAGNETTRHLMSCSLMELAARPDDRAAIYADADRIPGAVEECLRWVTPIQQFARTVTEDTELSGVPVSEGDYLVMLYASGNRDEAAFGPTAAEFDPGRAPGVANLGFGFGQHLCLGAALARLETRVLFEELAARAPPTPRPATRCTSRRAWSADPIPSRSSSTDRRTPDHRPDQRSSSMEDRITPGLYLEMTDRRSTATPPTGCPRCSGSRRRARDVVAQRAPRPRRPPPRAARVRPSSASTRSTTGFTAPEPPDGITGHHFRRYRRGPARDGSPAGRRSACRSS